MNSMSAGTMAGSTLLYVHDETYCLVQDRNLFKKSVKKTDRIQELRRQRKEFT